jgi:hypothetical protein
MQRSGENQGVRPPLPPFDGESARKKVSNTQGNSCFVRCSRETPAGE